MPCSTVTLHEMLVFLFSQMLFSMIILLLLFVDSFPQHFNCFLSFPLMTDNALKKIKNRNYWKEKIKSNHEKCLDLTGLLAHDDTLSMPLFTV